MALPTDLQAPILARVEAALAGHVGPIARVLVRRAARRCDDEESLRLALAEHVTNPDARARFIGSTPSALSSTSRSTPPLRHATTDPAPVAPAASLSEAWIHDVQRVLARHIGPIAKVVLKKAIDRSTDRGQVLSSLADAIAPSAMRDQIVAELARVHDGAGQATRDR